jgi:hypothetical protein
MRNGNGIALAIIAGGLIAGVVAADEQAPQVRRMEKTPVTHTELEERVETIYRTEHVTEFREETRTAWVPTTQYRYQPRWQYFWNPLIPPQAGYVLKPVVRWELRTQTVRIPVTAQRIVPETKVVHVPVRRSGFVEREQR